MVQEDELRRIEELFRDSFRGIFAYCLRRLLRRQLAEDAVAAVFLHLVDRYETIRDRSDRQIVGWLYGAANNAIAACRRDSNRQQEIAAELSRQKQAAAEDAADPAGRLDWPLLYEAIDALKPKHQEMVTLRYFQGLQTAEIAEIMGMRHSTVRAELTRAAAQLKLLLGKQLE